MPETRSAPLPTFVKPQLATLVDAAPEGDDWIHEIKYDGFRFLARYDRGRTRLITRNEKDWTERFGAVVDALSELPAERALLDGEVAVLLPNGTTSFQGLQNAGGATPGQLLFFAFDLLHLDGVNVMREPLEARKSLLESLVGGLDGGIVRYSDHVIGQGPAFHAHACRLGLEGIISKRRNGLYEAGRSREWLKVKCLREQEFVVVGWTEPQGSREGLGALLLGAHVGGELRFVGKVGTGFDAATLVQLQRRLSRLEVSAAKVSKPPRGAQARGVHWVRPEVVAQVAYTEMTADGILRHPSYKGLREDKSPRDVVIEEPEQLEAVAETEAKPMAAKRAAKKKPGPAAVKVARKSARPGRIEVAGVSLSNPDKVLYEGQDITKLDLARYYEAIADAILPHIENRPLTLVRCPSGYGDCFYQKHIDESAPASILRVELPEDPEPYGAVNSLGGIVSLVQLGVLELHTWGARRDRIELPDRIVLDLDPDEGMPWSRVVEAAHAVREALRLLDLDCFIKTTGGKGLHVVVPFRRRYGWDEIKAFSRGVCQAVAASSPGKYTLNIAKAKRKNRILLDYLRNGRGATAVEAYSTRARAGAPVAMPIDWDDLAKDVRETHFNIRNVPGLLAKRKRDPWKDYAAVKQSITAAMMKRVGAL